MNTLTKQELADWIAALRSGNFKQGRGQLCYINSYGSKLYCCLGVYAEIKGMLSQHPKDPTTQCIKGEVNDEYYCAVMEPVTSTRINMLTYDLVGKLITRNDNEGKSFNEIADYLESFMEKAQ